VRRAARQSKTVRFTALLHHITTDLLKQSYLAGGSGRLDTRLDTPPSIIRRHPDSPLSSERAQGYLKLPVGGTSLTLNVSDGSVAQEGAWPGSGGGEGEGIFFDRPSWHSSERPLLSNGSNSRSPNAYVIDVTDSGRQPCVPDDHRAGRSDGSLVSVPDGRRVRTLLRTAGSSILRHQTVLCLRQGRLQRFCSLPVCDLRRRGGIYIVLTTSSILC
jgi:hypothetical protein